MECTEIEGLKKLRGKILAELRSEMNGAVVESMLQYNGGEPFFSYGVSLPCIKREALKQRGNHELALLLFESEIRELKLAAIYVDTPNMVTSEQMKLWSGCFHSPEIADNASTMLFYGAPEALPTASEWIREPRLMRSAMMMIGKRLKVAYSENERPQYGLLLKEIEPLTKEERNHSILDAVSYVLTSLHLIFPKEVEDIVSDDSTLPYIKATIMIV